MSPLDSTLRRTVLWLIAGRAAIITVLLGSAILIQIRTPGTLPADPFFFLIGLTYALTAIWASTLRFALSHRWLIDVQLACDALLVTALVALTGGSSSYFSSLYTLPIIAASIVPTAGGGMLVGLLSSGLYGGLVGAQYAGLDLLATPADVLPPARIALFTTGLNVFGFVAVAMLSGYLAAGLRRAGDQLAEASSRLADLQAFSQHIVNSLTSGLATADVDGRLLTMNRAAEGIVGQRAADAVGRPVLDVLQLPAAFEPLFHHDAGDAPLPRLEYGFERTDQRTIELGISTAVLFTPRGKSGFLFTFQDVTETKRQEREAQVQQRLAAVGEMAAGIAHEIRNPLASMAGSIQMLRQELPLSEEQSQLMDIVLRESERLNGTIRSFLAYARPQRTSMARMDVRQVVSDTARLLRNSPECTEKHEVVVDAPAEPVWYEADEGQIRQVVWNLATNGIRAMPDGGQLRLAVAGSARGLVEVAVQDAGVGIASEELGTIFHPFRGGFERGTGLGLSIVHRIVSDYGGEVRVTSRQGHGTTVRIALPVTSSQPAAESRQLVGDS